MKRILSFVLCAGLLVSLPAAASETIVVEAPWLVGPVTPYDAELEGTIVLPDSACVVLGASIELDGLAVEGTVMCLDDPEVYPGPVGVSLYLSNACIDQVPGYFAAEILEAVGEGTFSATVVWVPFGDDPAPWSCWVHQPLHASLGWAYGLPGICDYVAVPSLDIAAGRFLVEIDPAIAVTATTWGALKALYR